VKVLGVWITRTVAVVLYLFGASSVYLRMRGTGTTVPKRVLSGGEWGTVTIYCCIGACIVGLIVGGEGRSRGMQIVGWVLLAGYLFATVT
jgi:hypothetical protein